MLTVDRAARTIHGRAVPFDVIGRPQSGMPRRYPSGSLTWDESSWLLIEHDESLRVGQATAFAEHGDGLWVTFLVRRGLKGDHALELAATTHGGLSINTVPGAEFRIAADGIRECVRARVFEVSLTKNPVFK